MSQLQDIQALVQINIGGRDDSVASTVIKAAINYAIILAALTYKPPELRSLVDLSYTANSTYLDISANDWVNISLMENVTDDLIMRFLPYDRMDTVLPSNLAVTKYYSLYGDKLFVRKIPTATKSLRMSALVLPAILTQGTDSIPFEGYDAILVSWATMLTQAAFEEIETAGAWMKLNETLTAPLTLGAKERDILDGAQAYFDLAFNQAKGEK